MLLAAGRGERLSPLTDQIPKPLLPIAGKPLIVHLLQKLATQGLRDIVINVSHLADQIQQTLGNGASFGVNIQYSIETTPLETGGGIKNALPLLGEQAFLVINAKVWTDYPFAELVKKPLTHLAHLVLIDNPPHRPHGDFGLNNGLITLEDAYPRYTFSGIGLYQPQLFANVPQAKFRTAEVVLNPLIAQQNVSGEVYSGIWHGVEDPASLQALTHFLQNHNG